MKSVWRNNGLSIVLFLLFAIFLVGTAFAGHRNYNQDQQQHGGSAVSLAEYLGEGDFLEAVTENWESEFLQMAMFVLLTVFLYQKGSAESKDPDEDESVDAAPAALPADAPWPLRRGGLLRKFYENSLGLALTVLFLASIWLHAVSGAKAYNQELAEHGIDDPLSSLEYAGTARFWFESFQNWQSELLAIFAMVVLSIYLRQKGSPESKPVHWPHHRTGSD